MPSRTPKSPASEAAPSTKASGTKAAASSARSPARKAAAKPAAKAAPKKAGATPAAKAAAKPTAKAAAKPAAKVAAKPAAKVAPKKAAAKPAAKAAAKPAAKAAAKPAAKPSPAPRAAFGTASQAGPLGPYGDDKGVHWRLFGAPSGFAKAAGAFEPEDGQLSDGGIGALAIQDASGNRQGTVVLFQRQPGGAQVFGFDAGYNYWRFDRDRWGQRFWLKPLQGVVGLTFNNPRKWEITGAYPVDAGVGRPLPASVGRGRLWQVHIEEGSSRTATGVYLWRIAGGPTKLHRWFVKPSAGGKHAAPLALAAGQRLYFEEVSEPAKADKASDFHALDLPQSP